MKLIFCLECHGIVSLSMNWVSRCECGKSWGRYLDDDNARYGGRAIPLGIKNSSFVKAVRNQPNSGPGWRFEAFVIPRDCDTFRKEAE